MKETSYISILATLTTLIVVSAIFYYFYNDIKELINQQKIVINFSLLPETQNS